MRRHKLILVAFLLLPLVGRGDSPIQGPLKLLAEADRFALLNNWPKASPLFAEAESLLAQAGDGKGALAARLGYLWATADAGGLDGRKALRVALGSPVRTARLLAANKRAMQRLGKALEIVLKAPCFA